MTESSSLSAAELIKKSLDVELARVSGAEVPGNLVWRARRASTAMGHMIDELRSLRIARDNALAALKS